MKLEIVRFIEVRRQFAVRTRRPAGPSRRSQLAAFLPTMNEPVAGARGELARCHRGSNVRVRIKILAFVEILGKTSLASVVLTPGIAAPAAFKSNNPLNLAKPTPSIWHSDPSPNQGFIS
jgi:hypothetical protein